MDSLLFLVSGEVIRSQRQPSGSNQFGVYMLVANIQLTSSTWGRVQSLQNSSRIWLRILLISIALEEELKVFCFMVKPLLSCSTVFLCFCNSLCL